MQPDRLPGLDGLRCISITLVLLFHLTTTPGFPHVNHTVAHILDNGNFGVTVFFVLSGFLITFLLLKEERRYGRIDLIAFYGRRALRIIPTAAIYLLTIRLFAGAGVFQVTTKDVTVSLFFMRNMILGSVETSHFWSLAVEEQFYIIWPLLLFFLSSRRLRIILTSALIALAPIWSVYILPWLFNGQHTTNIWRFDLQYHKLLIGCFLALVWGEDRNQIQQPDLWQAEYVGPISLIMRVLHNRLMGGGALSGSAY